MKIRSDWLRYISRLMFRFDKLLDLVNLVEMVNCPEKSPIWKESAPAVGLGQILYNFLGLPWCFPLYYRLLIITLEKGRLATLFLSK